MTRRAAVPSQSAQRSAWTVPGKLMVAGEYAVLRPHGLALACAVGRVVEVRVRPGAARVATLRAFGGETRLAWDDPAPPATGLIAFAAAGLAAGQEAGGPRLEGAVDFDVFAQAGTAKVGLGTSAAVTVAAVLAALGPAPREHLDGLGERAHRLARIAGGVHANLQGGRGSGYDVGTIAHGGSIAWHRTPDVAVPLPWPAGMAGAALWSGTPAATAAQLERPLPSPAALDRIDAAARALLAVWAAGGRPFLDAVAACEEAFGEAVLSAPHLAAPALTDLAALVTASDCVARTSGAGGGDCLIAWTDEPGRLDALVAAAARRGFPCVARLPEDVAWPAPDLQTVWLDAP
ncbi:MAG: hypothetical protein EXR79_01500 [Myxococcales bacterium]|nr:hypothetical protein [Myxococcales bacterium]